MRIDDELLIGGGILLAMLTLGRSIEWGDGWVWPIPDLIDRSPAGVDRTLVPQVPTVSQEFRGASDPRPHLGVDLMYRARGWPRNFTAPPGVPVAAARSGTLWSVSRTPRGWAVVVDHGPPWATFYQHLEAVDPAVAKGAQGVARGGPGMQLAAGQRLGVMGSDPTDGGHVRHLHFATWYKGAGDAASVDPEKAMQTWGHWQWTL